MVLLFPGVFVSEVNKLFAPYSLILRRMPTHYRPESLPVH